jgi:abortive infection bacteriophage resistance protein
MSIKCFELRSSLKQKLKGRHLRFDSAELDEILKTHNYFNYFNGLETIFLKSNNPKDYDNIRLKDFDNLYVVDKEISHILVNCLDEVEEKLKASISYNFCKQHCTALNDTMQYTNKNNYMNPRDNNVSSLTYCRYSANYPFASAQNRKIYDEFQNYCLFKPYYLSNLVNRNDHIRVSFYQDPNYVPPSDVAIYRDAQRNENRNVAVPFWVAIETLTFGEILRLLHYLQDDVMKEVLNDFGLTLSKRNQFLNMLDFLLCLRNSCAHTTLINRFRTSERYKVNTQLISVFGLKPKNNSSPASVLKLFDVIKILSYFCDVTRLKRPIRVLMVKNICSMGIKKGHEINTKILDRMGNDKYSSWKGMLSGKEYLL